jgi:hypothetical protein
MTMSPDRGGVFDVLGARVSLPQVILMLIAAFIAARWAIAAERKPLEAVSRPLAACD